MTTETLRVGRRSGASIFYAGWAGFALFGTVAALGGHASWSYAAVHAAVAGAICTWHFMTIGKAAPIAGLVLGALFALEMAFFLSSDLSGDDYDLTVTLADGLGLLAGILILAGAVLGLTGRRA